MLWPSLISSLKDLVFVIGPAAAFVLIVAVVVVAVLLVEKKKKFLRKKRGETEAPWNLAIFEQPAVPSVPTVEEVIHHEYTLR